MNNPAFKHGAAAQGETQGMGSIGGTYTKVLDHKQIDYTMDDGRKVSITLDGHGGHTHITETFDPESENAPEMQRKGWQSILDNFKKHAEPQR